MHTTDTIVISYASGQCGGCTESATTGIVVNGQMGWYVCDFHADRLIRDILTNMAATEKRKK